MSRHFAIPVAALMFIAGFGSIAAFSHDSTTTTTTTTTTTIIPYERAQAGWTVASRSGRGVMVDYRNEVVGTTVFRVLRLRARTTLLDWHVGSIDPPTGAAKVPAIAGSSIDWTSEGLAGVVAVFNGGFKKAAKAGGAVVDGVTLDPLVKGDMTVAINAHGHWSMGVWGNPTFPAKGFDAVTYRQNLGPLVEHSKTNPAATAANSEGWGSPLNHNPLTPRTGLGMDAQGNLIFVATMDHIEVVQVAQALVDAGVVEGMELDINPFWPILGAATAPLHAPGVLAVQLSGSQHDASIYETGWQRDFFVAMAEPNSWTCSWTTRAATGPTPRLVRTGSGCRGTTGTTTSTVATSTTTTSTISSTTTSAG